MLVQKKTVLARFEAAIDTNCLCTAVVTEREIPIPHPAHVLGDGVVGNEVQSFGGIKSLRFFKEVLLEVLAVNQQLRHICIVYGLTVDNAFNFIDAQFN